ncbi:MAG: type II toxin-antitoxin system prevent-host-death family antitoxin [Chloroflexi bacterium]|nr:type II toxin-antitoxin system prevent-host-death family antitoxin [Chloroflexota bacterium]
MDTVTIRELRNRGRAVIDRVEAGESLIVSRDGRPVAELRPLPRKPLDAATLLEQWRHVPPADPDAWRRDVDSVVDQSL